ncbi:MAG: alpha/beta fold hydrolase [Cellulosilyticaceae bacterium]
MEHKYIESQYGTTHYWINQNVMENRRTIVFTHGVTADHQMFEKQVEYFSEVYRVIVWDVPLHGLSRPYKDFSYTNAANELHSILAVEGIEKVVLVGMSMGGYPSQEFARLYPEKVEGFVALDTTPFGMKYYSKTDLWWLRQVAPMARCFTDGMLRKSMAKSVSKTKYSYDMMMQMLEPLNKTEIIAQMEAAYSVFSKENKDVDFAFPVLILLGEYDTTGKVKQYCKMWAKETGYPLHIIKDAAHFTNGDNPIQVNKEIEEFVLQLK